SAWCVARDAFCHCNRSAVVRVLDGPVRNLFRATHHAPRITATHPAPRIMELSKVWAFLCRPLTRYILSWLAAVGVAVGTLWHATIAFSDPQRPDGNNGHMQIDFGGQWVMARMLVEGHGRELYNRDYLRRVVTAAYPVEDQAPDAKASDADQLMAWMM